MVDPRGIYDIISNSRIRCRKSEKLVFAMKIRSSIMPKYCPKDDVDYAIRIARAYLEMIGRFGIEMGNSSILELGPGKNYGTAVILRCLGAQVSVADKYLSEWDPETHPIFYKALAKALPFYFDEFSLAPLNRILVQGGYDSDSLHRVRQGCESLSELQDGRFDVIVSNAVLEHLVDPDLGLRELYRITKVGGLNIHQIDYRDHRNFVEPLEYLFLSELEFGKLLADSNGECGNRVRANEFLNLFLKSGFTIDAQENNMFADLGYLNRIRDRAASLWKDYTDSDLHVLSGRIYCVKGKPNEITQSAICRSSFLPAPKNGNPAMRLLSRIFQAP
jgi:SAM-dependent methyltransferase